MVATGQEDGARGTGTARTLAGTSDIGPPGSGYLLFFLIVIIVNEYETCYLQILWIMRRLDHEKTRSTITLAVRHCLRS